MKRQFEKVKKLARDFHNESWKLDRMIYEKYGFSYSETDNDSIIDTLDYGTDGISFEEFCAKMDEYKKDFDAGQKFRAIP